MLLSGDSCGEIMFERDMGIVYHMHGTPPFLYPVPSPAVIALDRPFLGKIKRTGRQIESYSILKRVAEDTIARCTPTRPTPLLALLSCGVGPGSTRYFSSFFGSAATCLRTCFKRAKGQQWHGIATLATHNAEPVAMSRHAIQNQTHVHPSLRA